MIIIFRKTTKKKKKKFRVINDREERPRSNNHGIISTQRFNVITHRRYRVLSFRGFLTFSEAAYSFDARRKQGKTRHRMSIKVNRRRS